MINGEQIPKQMLAVWKTYCETYIKTLEASEEQGDRMLDLMLQQSDVFGEETKKLIKQWTDNAKNINKNYIKMVRENVKKMEAMLEPQKPE
jgi:hypothetical protein